MIGSWLMLAATVIAYHGELHDGDGAPVTSKKLFPIEFRLYDGAEGGAMLWGRRIPVQLDVTGNFYTELADIRGDVLEGSVYGTLDEALIKHGLTGLWVEMKPEDAYPISPRTRLAQGLQAHHALAAFEADAIIATNAPLTVASLVTSNLTARTIRARRLKLLDASVGGTLSYNPSGENSIGIAGDVKGITHRMSATPSVSASDSLHLYWFENTLITVPVPAGKEPPTMDPSAGRHIESYVFGKE